MNRFIQFTETDHIIGRRSQQYVMQYLPSEMLECFSPHELLWLSRGKIVERGATQIVDLRAWFERTKGAARV